MPIAVLMDYAGTTDQYDEARRRLGFSTGGPGPDGNLMHWATRIDDTHIRAVDVWESQAQADAFYNGPLAAILKDMDVAPPTSVVRYDIFDYQIADAKADRRGGDEMTQMAVTVVPIIDVGTFHKFADAVSTGARGDAHRAFLRRGGVQSETIFHQQTPLGDIMILVWDGVGPDQMTAYFSGMLQNPASDHERYLRDDVLPTVYGIDPTQPPPPPAQRVAEIST